ncbi:hypothetical protein PybrP1_000075 [[Pythium] brassicae (nom. inval.)]|nr:hypothetical protein PybrP1_000075 [[Pythium] brassicae (nom. inval.)]
MRRLHWFSTALTAVLAAFARAELNDCLGIEMTRMQEIPSCATLFRACEVGVGKLNQQLKLAPELRFLPVSVISASESKVNGSDNTLVAMLAQLAPIDECVEEPPQLGQRNATTNCTFDMSKVEIYSILVTLNAAKVAWSLDGYKHHSLAEAERLKIAEQYKKGKFFGSNLALGIFESPNMPLEPASNAQNKTFSRSPIGIFIVLGSAGLSVGLLFHHRRRLHNGYAPIVILKRRQQNLQDARRKSAAASAAANAKKPELASLRQPNPVPTNEDTTIKHEQNERFAV